MREHEFLPVNTHGFSYCKHCGVRRHDGMHETCLERPDAGVSDRPRRINAVNDFDAIGVGLAELRRQRTEALNTTDEGQAG